MDMDNTRARGGGHGQRRHESGRERDAAWVRVLRHCRFLRTGVSPPRLMHPSHLFCGCLPGAGAVSPNCMPPARNQQEQATTPTQRRP